MNNCELTDIDRNELDRMIDTGAADLQEMLRGCLSDERGAIRLRAATYLAEEFHDVSAVGVLAEAVIMSDWKARNEATHALWELGDANPASLIRALHFERGAVREAIGEALEMAGWIPDDVDTEVAFKIATWNWRDIARIGQAAVPGLISVLSDPDGNVRRGAVWTLGIIRDVRAVPWLIRCLDDMEGGLLGIGGRICDVAAESLERIGTEDALVAVAAWRDSQEDP